MRLYPANDPTNPDDPRRNPQNTSAANESTSATESEDHSDEAGTDSPREQVGHRPTAPLSILLERIAHRRGSGQPTAGPDALGYALRDVFGARSAGPAAGPDGHPVPLDIQIFGLFRQFAGALGSLHRQGLGVADLDTDKLLVEASGRARLAGPWIPYPDTGSETMRLLTLLEHALALGSPATLGSGRLAAIGREVRMRGTTGEPYAAAFEELLAGVVNRWGEAACRAFGTTSEPAGSGPEESSRPEESRAAPIVGDRSSTPSATTPSADAPSASIPSATTPAIVEIPATSDSTIAEGVAADGAVEERSDPDRPKPIPGSRASTAVGDEAAEHPASDEADGSIDGSIDDDAVATEDLDQTQSVVEIEDGVGCDEQAMLLDLVGDLSEPVTPRGLRIEPEERVDEPAEDSRSLRLVSVLREVHDLEREIADLDVHKPHDAAAVAEWCARASSATEQIGFLESVLEEVRGAPAGDSRGWTPNQLTEARDVLRRFLEPRVGTLARADHCHELLRRVEDETIGTDRADLWLLARRTLAADLRFGGRITLVPHLGLIPRGPSRPGGLHEFLHLQTSLHFALLPPVPETRTRWISVEPIRDEHLRAAPAALHADEAKTLGTLGLRRARTDEIAAVAPHLSGRELFAVLEA